MKYNEKKCIFITSIGRSGSRFIGSTWSTIIPNSASFHEPDILTTKHIEEWPRKFRNFGFFNMTVGKFIGRAGLRNLSNRRMQGSIDDNLVIEELLKRRAEFINGIAEEVYIENSWTFYGIFDLVILTFPNSNSVFIVRDPRTWVQSHLNWGHWYQKRDFIDLFNLGRLNPKMFGNDRHKNSWPLYSPFQKLCWAWNKITTFAISCIEHDNGLKIFKYEDLFLSRNRYEHMHELLEAVTVFPDGSRCIYNLPAGILDKVIHASRKKFAAWPQWSPMVCQQLHEICGETMKEFGYGEEPEWKGKLST